MAKLEPFCETALAKIIRGSLEHQTVELVEKREGSSWVVKTKANYFALVFEEDLAPTGFHVTQSIAKKLLFQLGKIKGEKL